MTSNSIKAQEAETNRRSQEESVRHNKRQEGIGISDSVAKHGSNIAKIFGSVAKAFINDPAWYTADAQLVKDVASIPYGRPLGMPVSTNSYYGISMPGVADIRFVPTIGMTRELVKNEDSVTLNVGNDGSLASTAAKALYAYVRHANSGSANYDAPDLFEYVLGIDSLLMIHGLCLRIYSLAKEAKAHNRYYPNGFLVAMGLTSDMIDSVVANLANFRAFINVLASKINAFYYPSQLTYFARHYWLVTHIFKDQDLKRSQCFTFTPELVYKYDELHGQLKPIRLMEEIKTAFTNNGGNFVSAVKAVVNPIVEEMLGSESIGIMSGDILKAFNDSALIGLTPIAEDFHIESVYSAEVLSQIDSAILPGPIAPDDINLYGQDGLDTLINSWTIWQDKNGIIWQSTPPANPATQSGDTLVGPYVWTCDETAQTQYHTEFENQGITDFAGTKINLRYGGNYSSVTDVVINQLKDDVSTDDTMVASRLSTTWAADNKLAACPGQNSYYYYGMLKTLSSCGSEVALYARTVRFNQGSNEPYKLEKRYAYDCLNLGQWVNLGIIDTYPHFDFAPKIRIVNVIDFEKVDNTTLSAVLYDVAMHGVFANYASVDNLTLNGMHTAAILSELGVPYFREKVASKQRR